MLNDRLSSRLNPCYVFALCGTITMFNEMEVPLSNVIIIHGTGAAALKA